MIVPSTKHMARLLLDGQVDILSETVMSAMHLEATAGAEILLMETKGGVAEYKSLIVAKSGGGMNTLADLRDRIIAVEDPGSTTGFLVPLAMIRGQGLVADELLNPRQAPRRGRVGYLFTGNELNIAAIVSRGVAHAGAISDVDWNDPQRTPPEMKKDLVVLAESEPMLRSVLLVRADLDPKLKAAIRETLLAAHDDPQGREALKTYYKVGRYGDIAASSSSLARARDLYALVRDRME